MKKLFFLIMFFATIEYLHGQNTFDLMISTEMNEVAAGGTIELNDHSIILSVGQGTDQFSWQRFYKINAWGDTLKSLTIFKDGSCGSYSMNKVNEFEIISVGAIMYSNKNADLWILCMDTAMNILWEKTYPTPNYMFFNINTCMNSNNNLVIVSTLQNDHSYTRYQLFMETTLSGDSIRSTYTGPNNGIIFDILQIPLTKQYVLPAIGYEFIESPGQILVLDSTLILRTIDSIPWYVYNCCTVKTFNDTSYFLSGNKSYPFGDESYNVAAMLLNSQNDVLYSAAFGRPGDTMDFGGAFQSMDFIQNYEIYVAGTSNISFYGYIAYQPSWYVLSKFDSTLNIYWTKYYGGDAYYTMQSITATSDRGAVLAGTRFDYLNHPENQLDVYVLKVDSTGLYVNVDEEKPVPVHDAIVYPNPGSDYLVVQSGPQVSGAFFRMYDMQGRLVMEKRLTSTLLRLNTNTLAAGTYPWQIIFNNKIIESGKWVKER